MDGSFLKVTSAYDASGQKLENVDLSNFEFIGITAIQPFDEAKSYNNLVVNYKDRSDNRYSPTVSFTVENPDITIPEIENFTFRNGESLFKYKVNGQEYWRGKMTIVISRGDDPSRTTRISISQYSSNVQIAAYYSPDDPTTLIPETQFNGFNCSGTWKALLYCTDSNGIAYQFTVEIPVTG